MSAPKIKNLVLLILLLVNIFLLALVIPTRVEDLNREHHANAALIQLYENAGVTLREEDIPGTKPLYPADLSLAEPDLLAAVRGLLGQQLLTQTSGSSIRYTSALGTAAYTKNGSFTAALKGAAVTDPEADARKKLDAMGLSCGELRRESSGDTVSYTACLTVGSSPILTHDLTFRYESDRLVSVTGLLLPAGEPARVGNQSTVTARDALTAFLGSRLETGWVGSHVQSATQGYALSYDAAQNLWHLLPAWRITTDAGAYLVDGTTKTVTALQ